MVLTKIPGYEFYYASSDGHIYSLRTGRPMAVFENNAGYLHLGLRNKSGEKINEYVHRLVAKAFIPNPNGYEQVNHKDENKLNNAVENLEWCSPEQNINYGTAPKRRGINIGKPVINLDTGYVYPSAKYVHDNLGIDKVSIGRVCMGKGHTAGGYH